ncbi:MAG: peptide-methionine (R)-S-oxide reductase MsrB [Candidatus Hodarchaeales archaeon]|jgi:peptide-methionine (R)-S-oxide reductase
MKDNKEKSEEEWKQVLTKKQFHILREKGTERAFTGKYWNHFEKGQYKCAGCGAILFESEEKFESNCGWPSFSKPIEGKLETQKDTSHGMIRTEVLCKQCGGHQGHIFNDGPPESGGLRYCINSESIEFDKFSKNNDKNQWTI